jgi:hypothetical protein
MALYHSDDAITILDVCSLTVIPGANDLGSLLKKKHIYLQCHLSTERGSAKNNFLLCLSGSVL